LALGLVLLVVASGPPTGTASQTQNAQLKDADKDKRVQRGITLVMDVLKDADSLRSTSNRVFVYKTAARLLAEKDPQLSAQLFGKALESIKAAAAAVADDDPQRNERLSEIYRIRSEVILDLSNLDPLRAFEALQADRSVPPPAEGTSAYMTSGRFLSGMRYTIPRYSDDQDITAQVVGKVARKNPDLALEFATKRLANGVSDDVLQAYVGLRERDPKLARSLARDIVARLKTEKPGADSKAAETAFAFLLTLRDGANDSSQFTVDSSLLDSNSLTDLMNYVADSILGQEQQPFALLATAEIEPYLGAIERYAPAKAARLRDRMARMKTAVESIMPGATSAMTNMKELEPLLEAGDYDRALQLVNKIPESLRGAAWSQVIESMMEDGQIARARDLVGTQVKDSELREGLLERMASREAKEAADKGDEEAAKRILPQLSGVEQKISVLISLARAAAEKGEKGKAVAILQQAETIPLKKGNELSNELSIIEAYVSIKPARAIESLKTHVEKLNLLLAAAAVLDGYFYGEHLQDGEFRYSGGTYSSGSPLLDAVNSVADVLAEIARDNFDEARAIADKFDRQEIRTFVELLVAESLVEPESTDLEHAITGPPMTKWPGRRPRDSKKID
jgi:hypothetical protein